MRIDQLTFTRFIAAIGIVIFHFGKGVYPFTGGALAVLINNSNFAVSYFFILSGFVMIIAYGRDNKKINTKEYYINRIAKIYPVYLLALLLMLFSTGGITYPRFIAELLLIHSAIPAFLPSYNLPDWSLSVEAFFYLIFPFLLNRVYLNKSINKTGVIIVCIWLVSQLLCYVLSLNLSSIPAQYVSSVFYNPIVHLNEFLIGNLIGLAYLALQNRKFFTGDHLLTEFLILLAAVCVLLPAFKAHGLKLPVNYHDGLLSAVFAPFILLLALSKGYISKVLSISPLVYLGEISYCIYILQFPVFIAFRQLYHFKNAALALYVPLVVLIAFSSLVYIKLEIPGKRYLRKQLKRL